MMPELICPVYVLHYRRHNGNDEDEHAEHHEDHASPPALARGVDDAHALDALLVAARDQGRAQDGVLNRRLVAPVI